MRVLSGLLLATLVLAAGCSSPPQSPREIEARANAPQAAQVDKTPITGSRLARGASDRNVRAAGSDSVRNDVGIRSLGNEVATPGR